MKLSLRERDLAKSGLESILKDIRQRSEDYSEPLDTYCMSVCQLLTKLHT